MLFEDTVPVYCENHTEHTCALCRLTQVVYIVSPEIYNVHNCEAGVQIMRDIYFARKSPKLQI
jgi:hypothetical protein